MSAIFAEVEQQASQLSTDDRARLAELLLETLPGSEWAEFEDEWRKEIGERVAAYERGEIATHAAEDVFFRKRIAFPGERCTLYRSGWGG